MSDQSFDELIDNADEFVEPQTLALPLDAWHRARGARMVEFAGYHMPIQYEGIMAEHLWTRESAGLFDVSHMGQLEISGEGSDAALEAVLPIDLSTLKPDRQRYSLLLDENGGVLDDLMVTNAGDHHYLVVNGATKWDDMAHLRDHLPDDVTLSYLDDQSLLALQGPKAVDALARLNLAPVGVDAPRVEQMIFMQSGLFHCGDVLLRVSRSGYTGEDGYEISVPAEHVAAFADLLCGQPEVKPIGLGARDSLRLEAGLPLYGHDLSPEKTPVAADLIFGINKRRREQGGFLGAETVLAELAHGAASKRVGLLVDGRQPVREGAEVVDADGAVIGQVTSGGFAPSVGAPIAMAYVPSALATAGTTIQLRQRGKGHSATVTAMPFVPHRYVRKGGQ